MQLRDLRKFVNSLGKELDEYEMVNGEMGLVDPKNTNSAIYRVDKPIIALYVDDNSKEVCMFHQTQEDLRDQYKTEDNGSTS
ncbi:hypothetical protein AWW74_12630 [Streptococcus pneumoniae]|nr:hypothetical protein AWW74_12630 [Streptococcus pneumoniae]